MRSGTRCGQLGSSDGPDVGENPFRERGGDPVEMRLSLKSFFRSRMAEKTALDQNRGKSRVT